MYIMQLEGKQEGKEETTLVFRSFPVKHI